MYNQLLNPFVRGYFGGGGPRVIGHRGSAGTRPENTLPSFKQAVADGADIVEMDVRLTSDGEIVVIHDPKVDRTTNGKGDVSSMTLAELKALDAGYRFTPDSGKTFPFRGKGVTIPTFEEVLRQLASTPLNVEIKVEDRALVRKFFALLRAHNRLKNVIVLVAAERNSLMDMVRSEEPTAVTGHAYWEAIRFIACTILHLPWLFTPKAPAMQVPERSGPLQVVTGSFVRYAHKLGMEVHVWTVNDEDDMVRLLSLGVDGLFTDFPGRMRKLVDSGKWRKPGG